MHGQQNVKIKLCMSILSVLLHASANYAISHHGMTYNGKGEEADSV